MGLVGSYWVTRELLNELWIWSKPYGLRMSKCDFLQKTVELLPEAQGVDTKKMKAKKRSLWLQYLCISESTFHARGSLMNFTIHNLT